MASQLRLLHILTTGLCLISSPVFLGQFQYSVSGNIIKRQASQDEWTVKCKVHEGKVSCGTEMSTEDLSFLCPCDSELKSLAAEVAVLQEQVSKLMAPTEGGGEVEPQKLEDKTNGSSDESGDTAGNGETSIDPGPNTMEVMGPKVGLKERCSNTSECQSGLVCDSAMRECRRGANGQCSTNHDCVSDTTCDIESRECRYGLGSSCSLTLEQCISHAACDTVTGTCKGHLGSHCNVDANCANGLLCDSASATCKQKPGGHCKDEMECVSGGSCEENVCKMKFNNRCETLSDCQVGYVCDREVHLCKYGVGHQCFTGQQSVCEHRAICDSYSNRCLVPLGYRCISSEECMHDSVCDKETSLCSVPIGGSCRGTTTANNVCVTGSECDVTSQICRTVPGVQCMSTSDCKAEYICDTARKVCVRMCSDDNHCDEEQVCDQLSRQCKTALRGTCSSSYDCSGRAGCFPQNDGLENRCLLPVGEQCKDSSECVWNSKCDIGLDHKTCRGMVNFTCQTSNDCAADLECDTRLLVSRCKAKRGNPCETNFDCVTGTACIKNEYQVRTCERGFNASCQSFTDCTRPMICDPQTATCKLNIKAKCETTSQCSTGYVCADVEKECIRPINGKCGDDPECIRGATCMVKQGLGFCKAQKGMACSTDFDCADLHNLTCDPMTKQCRRALGGSCEVDRDCMTGFRCRDNSCRTGCPGWADAMVYGGHCYLLHAIPRAQASAQEDCAHLGGHLVAIETQEEDNFIRAMLMLQSVRPGSLWMALYYSEETGWTWWYPYTSSQTSRLSFRPPWYDGYPSHVEDMNCGYLDTSRDYAWLNARCRDRLPGFICEKSDESHSDTY
ncbi:prion-like-(Q/N-rich) domain-bearing protein 25 isoform X2 [Lingula anatina]|uniref:Prion-like-(Q/N-rich) domain-bearing protein 25 isoform X2 n=1 Tax=Lingula anatina TaxID=7574 RepID=A0A1S3JH42_LINAN|nr:prion-like-(Q/N-rich) domain-bearing protein 25 isoform X2 [Lingula anatina]|eukprot:XP_013409678.1 prion-like-(Q/N-rich) domain-bearing protein 25 isoform X2 [Lingula anatina]